MDCAARPKPPAIGSACRAATAPAPGTQALQPRFNVNSRQSGTKGLIRPINWKLSGSPDPLAAATTECCADAGILSVPGARLRCVESPGSHVLVIRHEAATLDHLS